MIKNEAESCNFMVSTMSNSRVSKLLFTGLNPLFYLKLLLRRMPLLFNFLKRSKKVAVKLYLLITKKNNKTTINSGNSTSMVQETESLNLEAGDWVEVLSMEEISLSLDSKMSNKGLLFMSNMEAFCGGKFQVMKKVSTIKLESTGEVRKFKNPTVILKNVYCDGKNYDGCDRTCFHLWRESWLKRLPASS